MLLDKAKETRFFLLKKTRGSLSTAISGQIHAIEKVKCRNREHRGTVLLCRL